MKFLRVKNWEQFQQYKDRDPKWIKLHRDVLDDYDFDSLNEIQQLHLLKIWLLAAKLGNKIPNDAEWVARKIGAQSKVELKHLVTSGFLCLYEPVQECTEVYTEREEETEREVEEKKEKEGAPKVAPSSRKNQVARPDDIDEQTWSDFLAHRRAKKAKLTPSAWKPIRKQLDLAKANGHDPNEMLCFAMAAGWQTFEFDWFVARASGNKRDGPSVRARFADKTYTGTADEDMPECLRP